MEKEIKVGDVVYCTLPYGTFTVLEVAIVNGNVMYYINNKDVFTWAQLSQLQKLVNFEKEVNVAVKSENNTLDKIIPENTTESTQKRGAILP